MNPSKKIILSTLYQNKNIIFGMFILFVLLNLVLYLVIYATIDTIIIVNNSDETVHNIQIFFDDEEMPLIEINELQTNQEVKDYLMLSGDQDTYIFFDEIPSGDKVRYGVYIMPYFLSKGNYELRIEINENMDVECNAQIDR